MRNFFIQNVLASCCVALQMESDIVPRPRFQKGHRVCLTEPHASSANTDGRKGLTLPVGSCGQITKKPPTKRMKKFEGRKVFSHYTYTIDFAELQNCVVTEAKLVLEPEFRDDRTLLIGQIISPSGIYIPGSEHEIFSQLPNIFGGEKMKQVSESLQTTHQAYLRDVSKVVLDLRRNATPEQLGMLEAAMNQPPNPRQQAAIAKRPRQESADEPGPASKRASIAEASAHPFARETKMLGSRPLQFTKIHIWVVINFTRIINRLDCHYFARNPADVGNQKFIHAKSLGRSHQRKKSVKHNGRKVV